MTEDADLGIRLHKPGYRTAIIDSTTYEEANSDVYNWIRQRSRWVKGYIQTWLVHMRHPVAAPEAGRLAQLALVPDDHRGHRSRVPAEPGLLGADDVVGAHRTPV